MERPWRLGAACVVLTCLVVTGARAQQPPAATVRAEVEGQLDAQPGLERIRVFSNGEYEVRRGDGGTRRANLDPGNFVDALRDEASTVVLRVVDIDRRDHAREVLLSVRLGEEDPPQQLLFLAFHDGLLYPLVNRPFSADHGIVVPEAARVQIRGNGQVVIAFEECVVGGPPRVTAAATLEGGMRQRTLLRYVLADGAFRGAVLLENVTTTRRRAECVMAG